MAKKKNTPHAGGKGKKKVPAHHHTLHGAHAVNPVHEHWKHTALETGRDVIGVVVGGLLGAAVGKSSLLVGVVVTGAGHYFGNRWAQAFGTGMMASNGFQSITGTTNGLGGVDGVKDRLTAYEHTFAQKFYLDKFLLNRKSPALPAKAAGTAGFGEVQYFTYPDALMGDLAALSEVENQLVESALSFQGGHMAGDLPDMMGNDPADADETDQVMVPAGDDDSFVDVDGRLY